MELDPFLLMTRRTCLLWCLLSLNTGVMPSGKLTCVQVNLASYLLFYFLNSPSPSGGALNVCLSPEVLTLTAANIKKLMFPSPIELAEHLASLNVQDDTYPGTVSALLTFNDAAFAHYQLVLGGPPQPWIVSLAFCEGLKHFVVGLAARDMTFSFDPARFIFLQDSPVSAWVRLSDCNVIYPPDMPTELEISLILVRIRFSRVTTEQFQLVLEAIIEHDSFTVETANRSTWAKTLKAAPISIFAIDVNVTANRNYQLELLPSIKTVKPLLPTITDSSIRFAVLNILLECSPAVWSQNLLEWLAYARQPRHNPPPVLYDSPVTFPITQFIPLKDQSTQVIKLDSAFFQVVVGSNEVTQVDNDPPPTYAEALSTQVPPLVRGAATTQPQHMEVHVPVIQQPGVPVTPSAPPVAAQSPSTSGSQPSSQPSQQNEAGNRKFVREPKPSQKLKYSVNSKMADHLMPGLPPRVAASLQMAFAANTQDRMLSAYNHFVTALHGRCPLLSPHPFDSILILEYFMEKQLAPNTIANYMSALSRWFEMNNIAVGYKHIVSLCIRGYKNGSYVHLKKAADGFKLPFNFSTLKLICNGLQQQGLPPPAQAAAWSATLLAFWALLRPGEFLCDKPASFDVSKTLTASDVKLNDDGSVQLWIKTPKVASYHGDILEILPVTSNPSLCPVRALKNYLTFRRGISLNEELPLFLLPSGFPLTPPTFARWWKSALGLCDVPDLVIKQHTNHGLRSSLPSLLQLSNMPEDEVKILGRWRSTSAYNIYLKNTKARAKAKQNAMIFCQQLLASHNTCKS